jgi:hypothetical protein
MLNLKNFIDKETLSNVPLRVATHAGPTVDRSCCRKKLSVFGMECPTCEWESHICLLDGAKLMHYF